MVWCDEAMSEFERPFRAKYPEDWLASYTREYTSILQKGDGLLLVLDLKSANETVGFIAGSPSSGWFSLDSPYCSDNE